jgi:hypothetical protein
MVFQAGNITRRRLLEKLIVTHLIKKLHTSYGTQHFITLSCHWFLSYAIWIQSILSHLISVRSILILSSYLRLCIGIKSGLFPSAFSTRILCLFLISAMRCVLHISTNKCSGNKILQNRIWTIMSIYVEENYKTASYSNSKRQRRTKWIQIKSMTEVLMELTVYFITMITVKLKCRTSWLCAYTPYVVVSWIGFIVVFLSHSMLQLVTTASSQTKWNIATESVQVTRCFIFLRLTLTVFSYISFTLSSLLFHDVS